MRNYGRRTLAASIHSVALLGIALATAVVAVLVMIPLVPGIGLGAVFLIPWPVAQSRRYINAIRRLVSRWCQVDIAEPYKPTPQRPVRRPDGFYEKDGGLHKRPWWPMMSARIDWIFSDRATGKDLLWLLLHPLVGGVLAGLPLAVFGAGIVGVATGRWYALLALPIAIIDAPFAVYLYGRWCRFLLRPVSARRRARIDARREWLGRHLLAFVELPVLGLAGLLAFVTSLIAMLAFVPVFAIGLVVFFQPVTDMVRSVAGQRRALIRAWCHRAIEPPYRQPDPLAPEPDGRYRVGKRLYKTAYWAAWNERQARYLREAATWRDFGAGLVEPLTGTVVAFASAAGFVGAALFLIAPAIHRIITASITAGNIALSAAGIVGGLVVMAGSVALAPAMRRLYAQWANVLLAPTAAARLTARVERLTEARSDVIADQAAEVRRIERDLHDGAQARLIAVGLTLDAAGKMVDRDPETAKQLLAQAREASGKALTELRDLVRGVHPPVLAERGLGDAVRALALDCPLPVDVTIAMPSRVNEAIESAAYFAVAEALANAVRHANASHIVIDLRCTDGCGDGDTLHMTITDDGRGGAEPGRGTGLTGISRRLGALDGTVAVSSPIGGPTTVTMEMPCVLSSPKTSSC